ncbi:hypothetical protein POTOM_007484 [Populus tomentosa]|uniref:Bifunctional inhibitor/plant lipid transfer protein/seed storage helical domain-containing protein n=1 Tax=Populus tomentosa TaxID=118781 RepID=A0A8X8AA84_POPTO|nr:hypothetical protein POTOM_007484 [Populus tomentosa]
MASSGTRVGLVLLLVATTCGGAMAQSSCTNTLTSLAPCLNYITGNSTSPSSSCCSQLGNVVQTSPLCLCLLLNNSGASLGINVNQTLALNLPGSCKVQTPPISQCNAATAPTASATPPVSSPASSPADSSDQTPEPALTLHQHQTFLQLQELALKRSRHQLEHLMEVLSKHPFILCSSFSLWHGVVQLLPNSESQKWFVPVGLYFESFQSDLCPFGSLIMITGSYLFLYNAVKDDSFLEDEACASSSASRLLWNNEIFRELH